MTAPAPRRPRAGNRSPRAAAGLVDHRSGGAASSWGRASSRAASGRRRAASATACTVHDMTDAADRTPYAGVGRGGDQDRDAGAAHGQSDAAAGGDCLTGAINSIGLENVGFAAFLAEILPALERARRADGGEPGRHPARGVRSDGRAACTRRAAGFAHWHGVELNLSCPNVAEGGHDFGARPGHRGRLRGRGPHPPAGPRAAGQADAQHRGHRRRWRRPRRTRASMRSAPSTRVVGLDVDLRHGRARAAAPLRRLLGPGHPAHRPGQGRPDRPRGGRAGGRRGRDRRRPRTRSSSSRSGRWRCRWARRRCVTRSRAARLAALRPAVASGEGSSSSSSGSVVVLVAAGSARRAPSASSRPGPRERRRSSRSSQPGPARPSSGSSAAPRAARRLRPVRRAGRPGSRPPAGRRTTRCGRGSAAPGRRRRPRPRSGCR